MFATALAPPCEPSRRGGNGTMNSSRRRTAILDGGRCSVPASEGAPSSGNACMRSVSIRLTMAPTCSPGGAERSRLSHERHARDLPPQRHPRVELVPLRRIANEAAKRELHPELRDDERAQRRGEQ